MLLDEKVEVKWNNANRKHYESKGYAYTNNGDVFICNIDQLSKSSKFEVKVQCDYCGDILYKKYIHFKKGRKEIEKDCCKNRKCMINKSEEVSLIRYGVTNYGKTEERKLIYRDKMRTSDKDILDICESKGIKVLNLKDYENDRTRLKVICLNHKDKGVQDTNFSNIKANQNCCWHGRNDNLGDYTRLNGEFVYDEFIAKDFIPKFKPSDYRNNATPLPYLCKKHLEKGVQYKAYANLKYDKGCSFCHLDSIGQWNRTDVDIVLKEFISNNLTPIDIESYQNKEKHIEYKCNIHPEFIQKVTYGGLKNTEVPCKYCRQELNLSPLNKRLRSSIHEWRKDSEESCDYKCVLTGSHEYDVHHLYSFNKIIIDALEDLNIDTKSEYTGDEISNIQERVRYLHKRHPLGVCLRKDLHLLFHSMYSKDNTPEQFEEFKENYHKGLLEVS